MAKTGTREWLETAGVLLATAIAGLALALQLTDGTADQALAKATEANAIASDARDATVRQASAAEEQANAAVKAAENAAADADSAQEALLESVRLMRSDLQPEFAMSLQGQPTVRLDPESGEYLNYSLFYDVTWQGVATNVDINGTVVLTVSEGDTAYVVKTGATVFDAAVDYAAKKTSFGLWPQSTALCLRGWVDGLRADGLDARLLYLYRLDYRDSARDHHSIYFTEFDNVDSSNSPDRLDVDQLLHEFIGSGGPFFAPNVEDPYDTATSRVDWWNEAGRSADFTIPVASSSLPAVNYAPGSNAVLDSNGGSRYWCPAR